MLKITATLRTDGLDAYIARLPGALDTGAEAIAERTRGRWQAATHVRTGAYRASIFVQTHTTSDFATVVAVAQSRNPKAEIIPEPPKPQRKGAAQVGSAVKYAIYEELGTRQRAGHPAFIPAVAQAREELKGEIERRLRG